MKRLKKFIESLNCIIDGKIYSDIQRHRENIIQHSIVLHSLHLEHFNTNRFLNHHLSAGGHEDKSLVMEMVFDEAPEEVQLPFKRTYHVYLGKAIRSAGVALLMHPYVFWFF